MKKIILSALAVVAMASCSKNDETSFTQDDDQVRITTSIATRTVSAADGSTAWEDGDAIGVYMSTNENSVVFPATYSLGDLGINVKHTTVTGSLGDFSSTTPLYYPASATVDLLAYYPYSSSITPTAYSVDVSTQSTQSAIDLMKAEVTTSKSSDAVKLEFKHKLARIVLNISADGGLVDADLVKLGVVLSGTKTTASYDLTAADASAISNLASAAANITMVTTAVSTDDPVTLAEAIIIPHTEAAATLTFTTSADNNTFKATIPTLAFEIGKQYTYNVTIKNTGVDISTESISSWVDALDGAESTETDLTAVPTTE